MKSKNVNVRYFLVPAMYVYSLLLCTNKQVENKVTGVLQFIAITVPIANHLLLPFIYIRVTSTFEVLYWRNCMLQSEHYEI